MNLSCLTCQGMKRTNSFTDVERNMCNEKADNIKKLMDGVDNRSWSGNLLARPNNNNNNNSDDKIRNPTNFTTTATKKSINSSRPVPTHSSGPLPKTTTTTAVTATRFARSSSSYSRPIPVPSSGPLTSTNTTNNATGARLFGGDDSSSSCRVPAHSSSVPLTLDGITAATATTATGPPKLVRCGGMRRDWSFEDLRQMNSLKT